MKRSLLLLCVCVLILLSVCSCEKEQVYSAGSGTADSRPEELISGGIYSDTESWESVVGLD